MHRFATKRADQLESLNLSGYIFKKNSPSCGLERVRVYNSKEVPSREGCGLFAAAVIKRFSLMPAEEEGRLQDLSCVKTSSSAFFACHRWQTLIKSKSVGALMEFDSHHKFLLLAHNERHHRDSCRLVAAATGSSLAQSFDNYGREFMDALSVHGHGQET